LYKYSDGGTPIGKCTWLLFLLSPVTVTASGVSATIVDRTDHIIRPISMSKMDWHMAHSTPVWSGSGT